MFTGICHFKVFSDICFKRRSDKKFLHVSYLPEGIVLGIVLGWAPIGFAAMATPRPSQYYFGHTGVIPNFVRYSCECTNFRVNPRSWSCPLSYLWNQTTYTPGNLTYLIYPPKRWWLEEWVLSFLGPGLFFRGELLNFPGCSVFSLNNWHASVKILGPALGRWKRWNPSRDAIVTNEPRKKPS